MGIAFTGGEADFSGISPSAGRALYISDVRQQSFVDVNEQGTTAAAATAVGVGLTSDDTWALRADRPFLFVIRERLSGAILFMGELQRPAAGPVPPNPDVRCFAHRGTNSMTVVA